MITLRGISQATLSCTSKLLLTNVPFCRFVRHTGQSSAKPSIKPPDNPAGKSCGKPTARKTSKSFSRSSNKSSHCSSGRLSAMATKLFKPISKPQLAGGSKVTVVGAGQVGMATTIAILAKGISNDICLIDANKKLTKGQVMDLQHGSLFLNDPKIKGSNDFADSAGSRICVVTAGARQKKGDSRHALLQRNVDILKSIIPQLVKHSPKTIFLLVTNPVDIMCYVTWKISRFPVHRVLGSGTTLDSARFRYFISQRLGVATSSCHGYIIGEHGDSSVPVWSGVSVAGVNLCEHNPAIGTDKDTEKWNEVHEKVVSAAGEIIKLMGFTCWAVGLTAATLVSAMLDNTNQIYPVCTAVKGFKCIEHDVFLSWPCVLGSGGVVSIVQQTLNQKELDMFKKSADTMAELQAKVKL